LVEANVPEKRVVSGFGGELMGWGKTQKPYIKLTKGRSWSRRETFSLARFDNS
jgi:hypothetical protein